MSSGTFCSRCALSYKNYLCYRYKEPAPGSLKQPHLLGLDESVGKSPAILFYHSNNPLPIPFCHQLHLPLRMIRRNVRHDKSYTAVCAHCSSPLALLGKANLIHGLTCKSSDTDSAIGYSVSSNIKDK